MSTMKVWEDRDVLFDRPNVHKKLRSGENLLEVVDMVEDSKGNVGDIGRLIITNLRIMWYSLQNSKLTLSIGFHCINAMNTKNVISSKLRGNTEALYMLTSTAKQRFEFIFTDYGNHANHFNALFDVYKAYQGSVLYRELKLRSGVLSEGKLNILPQEQILRTVNGAYNLSSDQGNLGCFIITNVRLVWFADLNHSFNISLPYMQMVSIKLRESKYGLALVIATAATAGNYVLGFRIDPSEMLHEIYKELTSLHTIYSENPIFGVTYDSKPMSEQDDLLKIDEISEIDNAASNEINSKFTTYLNQSDNEKREPFYCKELGFAMEKLRDGYTLKDLWNVIGGGSGSGAGRTGNP